MHSFTNSRGILYDYIPSILINKHRKIQPNTQGLEDRDTVDQDTNGGIKVPSVEQDVLWVLRSNGCTGSIIQIIFIGFDSNYLMLTRSKIKMEESIRHTHYDAPYFTNDYPTINPLPTRTNNSPHLSPEPTRQNALSRNQILKELRQEYEILKNLPVDDAVGGLSRGYDQQERPKLSESSLSSSIRSKRSNPMRESEAQSGRVEARVSGREMQALHLEKKQLEIVIGNSMRKIEQLLNNEFLLKKTIHELKTQAESKNGQNQHEKALKAMQKAQDDLQEQLNAALLDNDKQVQRTKDLSEKVRQLEGELAGKEREVKQSFDEQRRLHQLIRLEKDKYLNLEIQCKGFKMEIDLLEKEKTSEVNRLLRQFESKEGAGEKEMAFLIRKLEEEVKEKDRRCHELLVEREHLRNREQVEPVSRPEKNYLEEFMYKSREYSDTNNKALADNMNLIISKMAELERKNDDTLRRQAQALRKKSDDGKRTAVDVQLIARVAELERTVERDTSEKIRLTQEISRLRDQKYELEDSNKDLQKKWRAAEEQEVELREQIEALSPLRDQLLVSHTHHKTLQEETASYIATIKSLQAEIDGHRQYVANLQLSFKEKEKKYEDEVRVLKRRVDEAEFETEKARKEAEFNHSLIRADHELEAKRIVDENAKLDQRLKETQEVAATARTTNEVLLKQKESDNLALRNANQLLRKKAQDDLLIQKEFYDAKLATAENRHNSDLKDFNDRLLSVTTANEKLLGQLSVLSSKEPELMDLRRLLKQSTAMNAGVSHLWEIKEAEYGNINQVLSSLRTV